MKQKQKRKHLERTFCPEGAKKSRGNLNLHREAQQYKRKAAGLSPYKKAGGAAAPPSVYYSCVSHENKLFSKECRKLQKGVPQTRAAVQAWSPAPGDDFSTSEYFSCVSSPSKLALAHKEVHKLCQDVPHLKPELPITQKVEDLETCSPILRNDFPGDNRPSTSSALMRNERIMKVYYMHVQLKRGVAVLEDTKGGLEPPKKKMRIESIAFPEKIRAEVNHSDVLTHELLHDSEFNSDDEGQEKLGEAESLAQPVAAEERSRARTPEWLVAMNSGYRCMACCRVFPSLAVLQEHVENGVNEGFSCHVFHQVFGWLKSKRKKGRDKMKKN
ncbi:protein FAM170A-like isoform X2 [Dipodomys merriami]|uniref:protein FAM170A-like isoform X2 n=1 Tax=Dipodomys merriami TaxID=94247 RepID=UPI003850A361